MADVEDDPIEDEPADDRTQYYQQNKDGKGKEKALVEDMAMLLITTNDKETRSSTLARRKVARRPLPRRKRPRHT